eukprot:TRINITY_DN1130_c0_g1_i13.p1 TRINITY_DN1130_c0_g1~~TRINITY_DN1130_c0_g1_i13.p1  ORF type:complete len:903 (+),score=260.16 TRINITY_DN1130_c0_g1_i13:118-2826(+)
MTKTLRLFVTGYPPDTTKEKIEALFARVGRVEDVEMPTVNADLIRQDKAWRGISRGYAFVSVKPKDDEEKCIKTYNGTKWAGNILTVERAKPQAQEKIKLEKEALVREEQELQELRENAEGGNIGMMPLAEAQKKWRNRKMRIRRRGGYGVILSDPRQTPRKAYFPTVRAIPIGELQFALPDATVAASVLKGPSISQSTSREDTAPDIAGPARVHDGRTAARVPKEQPRVPMAGVVPTSRPYHPGVARAAASSVDEDDGDDIEAELGQSVRLRGDSLSSESSFEDDGGGHDIPLGSLPAISLPHPDSTSPLRIYGGHAGADSLSSESSLDETELGGKKKSKASKKSKKEKRAEKKKKKKKNKKGAASDSLSSESSQASSVATEKDKKKKGKKEKKKKKKEENDDDKKRLKAQRRRAFELAQQKEAQRVQLDGPKQNTKLVFDSDSDDDAGAVNASVGRVAQPSVSASGQPGEAKSLQLFMDDNDDDDDGENGRAAAATADDDDDAARFASRPEFEGEHGKRMFDLQRSYKGDERFKLTASFMPKEAQQQAASAATTTTSLPGENDSVSGDEQGLDFEGEKDAAMDILSSMFGDVKPRPVASTAKGTGPASAASAAGKKASRVVPGGVGGRYDPTSAQATRFEISTEDAIAAAAGASSADGGQVQPDVERVGYKPVPEVGGERHVELNIDTSLRGLFFPKAGDRDDDRPVEILNPEANSFKFLAGGSSSSSSSDGEANGAGDSFGNDTSFKMSDNFGADSDSESSSDSSSSSSSSDTTVPSAKTTASHTKDTDGDVTMKAGNSDSTTTTTTTGKSRPQTSEASGEGTALFGGRTFVPLFSLDKYMDPNLACTFMRTQDERTLSKTWLENKDEYRRQFRSKHKMAKRRKTNALTRSARPASSKA